MANSVAAATHRFLKPLVALRRYEFKGSARRIGFRGGKPMIGHRIVSQYVPAGERYEDGVGGAVSDGYDGVARTKPTITAARHRAITAARDASVDGLPQFRPTGDLPPGVHATTWEDFRARFGGTPRRAHLLTQVERGLDRLHDQGIPAVVVGGSFVGTKPIPNDVDMAWLGAGDEFVIGRTVPGTQVSMFPGADIVTNAPQLPGAKPGESFMELFQHDRSGAQRGAVLLSTDRRAPRGAISQACRDMERAFGFAHTIESSLSATRSAAAAVSRTSTESPIVRSVLSFTEGWWRRARV